MSALKRCISILGIFAASSLSAQDISPVPLPDPYRNFLGTWVGTIPVNPGNLPPTVCVVIDEKPDHSSMIWHYVFGHKGEKWYVAASKAIVLSPTKEEMQTRWSDGNDTVDLQTSGLQEFARVGDGDFVASVTKKRRHFLSSTTHETSHMAIHLDLTHLGYTWETEDPGAQIYSRFEFFRATQVALVGQNCP